MTGMGVTDIVYPILGAGRTMAVNNFQYINPVNIYKKLSNIPSLSEQFQATTGITDTGLTQKIKEIFKQKSTDSSGTKVHTVEGADENVPPQQIDEKSSEISTAYIVFTVISSIIALGMISFVINDMIMHPWIVRLIMICVLIVIVILNPLAPFAILVYYFVNAMWKYYNNTTLPDSERKRIIPYLYGFLPLTTMRPVSKIGRIFMSPFTYDPDIDAENLKWDKKEWLYQILRSFPNVKETLAIGGMNSLYKQYTESLGKIHEYDKIIKDGDTENIVRVNPFSQSVAPKLQTQPQTQPQTQSEEATIEKK
jgi:hypothetical protein